MKDLGCSFGDKDVRAVLLAGGDDGVHGPLQFPGAPVFHPGTQQSQGAGDAAVAHFFPGQQPQDFEEIALVEIGEGQPSDIRVKKFVWVVGTEAHFVMQDEINAIFEQLLRFFGSLSFGDE